MYLRDLGPTREVNDTLDQNGVLERKLHRSAPISSSLIFRNRLRRLSMGSGGSSAPLEIASNGPLQRSVGMSELIDLVDLSDIQISVATETPTKIDVMRVNLSSHTGKA
jgi:hypothetical protein